MRKSLKILIAIISSCVAYLSHRNLRHGEQNMIETTCAACDYKLDANAIKVTIGGKTVEVCCEECATKLKEAHASATAPRRG
jgi:hypothetical protein